MGKKLIFLDVDGTLTDYDNHIPAFCRSGDPQGARKRAPGLSVHRKKQGGDL